MADFPGLAKRTATDEEVTVADQSNLVKKSRYAYLRMEAVFVQGLTDGKGGYTIWKTIDKQLAHLRLKGPRYTEAFYKFIVDEDKRLFDGTRTLAAIKTQELTKFNMPTDTKIEAIVLNLPEHSV
ncbi:uncharacterized protein MELLADRAFT_57525 [Melampsora larici-populina 98AG31]|uniref:Uncharacterized protein n=1 Tax=Melampsora larici-populina (strain 98AG31 / pathotype 3-4-7) TaxID=747676 RepID=F4S3C3_MELLP|nr:uncharacterized protein MELLADRAFT_57525 [Melampsora larici-populina 98AG31]EGG00790.1 hypothetical protein MELLADRAFT_57525 [Melampsora larici-populina 98AG31]